MSESGSLFIREFVDKNLVDFDECQEYYSRMTVDELIEECTFLSSPEITAFDFVVTGRRYYALCISLIDMASDSRQLSDAQRSELIGKYVIPLKEYSYARTAPEKRDSFSAALRGTLNRVKTFGLYPKVAELILNGIVNYSGEFREGIVGEVLEE